MSKEVEVRAYRFSILPEWILSKDISHAAIRLFCVLNRWLGENDYVWPSRKTIAERMGCSVNTVDRAIDELEKIGAISVEHRSDSNGAPTSSLFYLWPATFGGTPMGGETLHGWGDRTPMGGETVPPKQVYNRDTIKRETIKENSSTPTPTGAEKWTEETKELTALLCNWNVKNGYKPFTLGPKQWADMDKLLRINQYTPDEVRAVIEWCQKDAFWNGNIRSTMKLRQKFDTLLGRMRQEGIGVPASSGAVLSPEQKNIALIYDLYDQGEEWYDDTTGEFVLANPASLCYTRPRDAQGNLVDAEGKPYKLTSQGQRQRVEA
jgi:hypothetical protein